MFTAIKKFLGPVKESVKGEIKKIEVARASILGVLSGSGVWVILSVLWAFLQYSITDPNFVANFNYISKLFQEKNYLAIFIAIGTFFLDFLRRKYIHGS